MPWPSKGHSGSEAEDGDHVFIRVQGRVEQHLHIRGDGDFFCNLDAVEQFGGVLIIQTGTKDGLVGLTPINSEAQQIAGGCSGCFRSIPDPGGNRILKQTSAFIGKTCRVSL